MQQNYLELKLYIILFLLGIIACSKSPKIEKRSDVQNAILYLKKNFKINPNPQRFDTIWINNLREQNRSTEIDSLIIANTDIYYYAPLDLNLIHYENYYGYKDGKREDYFYIELTEDKGSNTYFPDIVKEREGTVADYCWWSSLKNIQYNDSIDIERKDIKVYNSIKTDRMFGEHEIKNAQRRTGIEAYLNSRYRFASLSDSAIDSLFQAYDKKFHNNDDTLITAKLLYGFLTEQANLIRGKEHYGHNQMQLKYLKDQINLLFIKIENLHNRNTRYWIYKSGHRLRTRSLMKTGNLNYGFSYYIDEERICF